MDRPDAKILDTRYIGFFDCFNRGEFYEAHEVLEKLWLPNRQQPNGSFYKGLIQLAGAFVHLQKHRLQPAASLFKLARTNLEGYPSPHEQLDVAKVLALIEGWIAQVESGKPGANPLSGGSAPKLGLIGQERPAARG